VTTRKQISAEKKNQNKNQLTRTQPQLARVLFTVVWGKKTSRAILADHTDDRRYFNKAREEKKRFIDTRPRAHS
jgi:hypothetical protein